MRAATSYQTDPLVSSQNCATKGGGLRGGPFALGKNLLPVLTPMMFLRLLAMLWLFYVTLRILRSLKSAMGEPPRPGPGTGPNGPGSPFDAYGPFGRFGPFGPYGPFGSQQQGRPGAPPPGAGPFGYQGPFAGGDPFAQQRAQQQQQHQQQQYQQQASAAPKGPYEILGVRPGSSMAEVRHAYQDLVRQYHPDRTDGLGPELRALAEQRTKEITAAYNQIKRRG